MRKNSKYRIATATCILILISLTPYEIALVGFQINLAVIFLYLYSLGHIILVKKKVGIHNLLCTYVLMLAYASFLLFELYDPVWILFNRVWMIACVLGYLSVMLFSDKKDRILFLIIAIIQGEFLFAMIVKKIGFAYSVGTGQFLDTLSSAVLVLVIWSICESIIVSLDQYMNQHVRGKQKST
ncbi:hypothetical protein [Bacillus sp. T3]|uniref:YphA family membrane protein n=1 Tax=Bacillus sp. T3 TaxID=467262 RepID=UPI00298182F3|nr:hypothetical protein [Bacillus sp. T3]